jgi:hypothetical protein
MWNVPVKAKILTELAILFLIGAVLARKAEARDASLIPNKPDLGFLSGLSTKCIQPPKRDLQDHIALVSQIGGANNAVAGRCKYAYTGNGLRLVVLVVSSSHLPIWIRQTIVLPGRVTSVTVDGDDAHLTDYAKPDGNLNLV